MITSCTFRANIVRFGRRSPVICSCSAMCPIFVLQRWFLWYVYTVYFFGFFPYIYSHYTRICILNKDSIRFTLWIRFQNDMIWFKHVSFVGVLAHLSQRLKWAFLITICPLSVVVVVLLVVGVVVIVVVNFSHCFFFSRTTGSISTKGLAQSILGWRRFKFVQMKGHVYFQGEIITKEGKF